MRKLNYIALALLAAAITAVSCNKEEMQSSSVSEGTVLTASIAQSTDTKTNMSSATENTNVSIVWTAGDKLSVLSGASYGTNNEFTLKSGDEGKTSGSFTGTDISGDIIAVYPYASDVAYSTNKVTLNIPQTQAYTDATFAQNSVPMVAKGIVGTNLSFNYLFSAIAFKVNGSGKSVTKVTVAATTPLWGPAEISNLDATPTITMTGTDSKYCTAELTCATAQDISSDRVFYIAVPAGTYTFAVNVYCSDNTVFHQSYTTAKTFTIGKIKYNSTVKDFSDNGPAYVEGSYIGEGTKVAGYWWAPVNCGYDATNAPKGLFYQWGRKYGQANTGTVSYIESQASSMAAGNTEANKDKFYKGNTCWFSGNTISDTWSSEYDPCPAGWRVPNVTELSAIASSTKSWTKTGGPSSDQTGYMFGTSPNQVFFPFAGYRVYSDGSISGATTIGSYWSSSPHTSNADDARSLEFNSYPISATVTFFVRAFGHSVRCVQE